MTTDGVEGGTSRQSSGLPRAFVVLVGAAAVVIIGAGVQLTAWLIAPLFMAMVIVIAVAPVSSWLRRKGCPGWLATIILILLVYAVVISLAVVIIVSLAQLATILPQYADQSNELVNSISQTLASHGIGPDQLKSALSSLNIGNVVGAIGSLLSSVAGLATSFVFLLALLLFLSAESAGVPPRIVQIAKDRPRIAEAFGHFAWGTRRYLLVTTVFGGIVAVLDTIGLAIIGIPLAYLWGLLAFITNYIPNVGFILGLIPPALLGLLGGGWGQMVAVIILYCALNLVIQSLVQPHFIGDSVGLSATVTFVALLFWAWMLGPSGAILVIPLTLLAKALLVDIDPKAGWADALLRDSGDREADPTAKRDTKRKRKRRRKSATTDLKPPTTEPVAG